MSPERQIKLVMKSNVAFGNADEAVFLIGVSIVVDDNFMEVTTTMMSMIMKMLV